MKKVLFPTLLSTFVSVMAQPFEFTPVTHSGFIETTNIAEVDSYIEPGTLVVIELENVVMQSATQLGSEQWADMAQHYYIPPGGQLHDGRMALTPLWNQILRQVTMCPVDMSIQAFVRRLQREGYAVIGLSTKDPDMAYVMLDHLKGVDINMTRTAPHTGHVNIPQVPFPAKMVHGVLFSGVPNDLGDALGGLIQEMGPPNKVVMLSHKQEHLNAAATSLGAFGIPFVGVRVGLADWSVARFRPELAEVQLNFFGRPLTNEAAKELLPKSGWFW